jgi:protein-tyrosine phosphatase
MSYDCPSHPSSEHKKHLILFLCTGNYYRSRFAELIFNNAAARAGLDWRADSRGLDIGQLPRNHGPISLHTLQALEQRHIPVERPLRFPLPLSESDLSASDRVIALKEAEHRPMVKRNFPKWLNHVEFWHVNDLDQAMPEEALPQIETAVLDLVRELALGKHDIQK